MPKHNRRYKDSVFVDLFGEDKNAKEKFLSLYNALHGTTFDAATKLEPLRLELLCFLSSGKVKLFRFSSTLDRSPSL